MPRSATSPAAPASQAKTNVTFTMHWPSAGTTAATRTRAYVPTTAMSVSVSVNGGVPQYLNTPSTTLTIAADAGVDTFAFATYDEPGGQGNVLSKTSITQTIDLGGSNTVSAVLNGVIASLALSLSNAKPNAGTPATVTIAATAQDADGNTIVGSGGYNTPIKLAVGIPASIEAGAVSLSTAALQSPSQSATLKYTGATLTTAYVTASAAGVPNVTATFAPTPTFYSFDNVGTAAESVSDGIAEGSDGNMWVTKFPGSGSVSGAIARVTPAGVATDFIIPTPGEYPQSIISASDGNLWFTENGTKSAVVRLTTSGTFTEYQTAGSNDSPNGLVDRGDGTIWFAAPGTSTVGYAQIANGEQTEFKTKTPNAYPFGITTALDDNLYYTEADQSKIGQIVTTAGGTTTQNEVSLSPASNPQAIVAGPDGNLWFTETNSGKIGRLTPNPFVLDGEFPTLTANSQPNGIVVGQDKALWFTEEGADRIGRITTDTLTVTEYQSPSKTLGLTGIALAPDGSLWYCEAGQVGKLVY